MRRALGSGSGASKPRSTSKLNPRHLKHKPKAKLNLGAEGEDEGEDEDGERQQQKVDCIHSLSAVAAAPEQQQRPSMPDGKSEKRQMEEEHQQPGADGSEIPRSGRPGLGKVANALLSLASGVATGAAASQASRR